MFWRNHLFVKLSRENILYIIDGIARSVLSSFLIYYHWLRRSSSRIHIIYFFGNKTRRCEKYIRMSYSLRIFNAIKQSRTQIAQATTAFRFPLTVRPNGTANFAAVSQKSGKRQLR